jgi:hypothetical protein
MATTVGARSADDLWDGYAADYLACAKSRAKVLASPDVRILLERGLHRGTDVHAALDMCHHVPPEWVVGAISAIYERLLSTHFFLDAFRVLSTCIPKNVVEAFFDSKVEEIVNEEHASSITLFFSFCSSTVPRVARRLAEVCLGSPSIDIREHGESFLSQLNDPQ